MARIDERLHRLLYQRIFVFFHSLVEHLVIAVAFWDAAGQDARLLYAHEHLVVFEVKDLALKLELLREVGDNQGRHHFASRISHLLLL